MSLIYGYKAKDTYFLQYFALTGISLLPIPPYSLCQHGSLLYRGDSWRPGCPPHIIIDIFKLMSSSLKWFLRGGGGDHVCKKKTLSFCKPPVYPFINRHNVHLNRTFIYIGECKYMYNNWFGNKSEMYHGGVQFRL